MNRDVIWIPRISMIHQVRGVTSEALPRRHCIQTKAPGIEGAIRYPPVPVSQEQVALVDDGKLLEGLEEGLVLAQEPVRGVPKVDHREGWVQTMSESERISPRWERRARAPRVRATPLEQTYIHCGVC